MLKNSNRRSLKNKGKLNPANNNKQKDKTVNTNYESAFPRLLSVQHEVNSASTNLNSNSYINAVRQSMLPSQNTINNYILFTDFLKEIDILMSNCNFAEMLQNIKKLNQKIQTSQNKNDQVLAIMVYFTSSDNGN